MAHKDPQIAVLAGGSGTRFWPAGRGERPKQVLALDGADPRPLLGITLERLAPLSRHGPWVVAPRALDRALRRAAPDLARDAFVLEPVPRNTAAALVLTALEARRRRPGAPVLAVPADHHVRPLARYRKALAAMAARAAATGAILTLGLRPDRPATGYGYLRLGAERARAGGGTLHLVTRYVEKPSLAQARRLVRDGRHLWNGGTFAFVPEVLLAEAERHLPEVHGPLAEAYAARGGRPSARALAAAYAAVPSISVDYGIMERTDRIEVLAADLEWDDLGTWDAVARHLAPDAAGNRVRGAATLLEAQDCLVDAGDGHVALLGVDDLIVVRTGDAVLVARRGRGEDVRRIVERLRAEGRDDLL